MPTKGKALQASQRTGSKKGQRPELTGYRLLDHDPDLDRFRRAWRDEPRITARICRKSGVSNSCISSWLTGKTRKPQNITLEFVMRAMGYERSPWSKKN